MEPVDKFIYPDGEFSEESVEILTFPDADESLEIVFISIPKEAPVNDSFSFDISIDDILFVDKIETIPLFPGFIRIDPPKLELPVPVLKVILPAGPDSTSPVVSRISPDFKVLDHVSTNMDPEAPIALEPPDKTSLPPEP